MILILFTASYPYVTGGEQNFLEEELKYLVRSFERVILVPEKRDGEKSDCLPQVEVVDEYSIYLHSHNAVDVFLNGIFSVPFFKELIQKPFLIYRLPYLKRLAFFVGRAEITRRWVVNWIKRQNIETGESLFYTYWFDQAAMGIGLAKQSFQGVKLISRAHGYDVYEERISPPYWPCRESILATVDFLFPDSDSGTDYLRKKYPQFASHIETARLGISNTGILAKASSDDIYHIVSCSRMVPVKRLDLMMQGIIVAAKQRSSQKFEWCHFGTGPLKSELELAVEKIPENIKVNFAGYTTQLDLFNYYRDNPVDIFINVSQSEGTPVAVMEAISCGIPAIVTAVGGNKEIVSKRNGYLLSENPTSDEIATALLKHWDEPDRKREGSREMWHEKYDSDKNFSSFTEHLSKIREYVDFVNSK